MALDPEAILGNLQAVAVEQETFQGNSQPVAAGREAILGNLQAVAVHLLLHIVPAKAVAIANNINNKKLIGLNQFVFLHLMGPTLHWLLARI